MQVKEIINGYYLSVYTCINKVSYYYNVPARHDHNMALWKYDNGKLELVHFWEFERITGLKKHEASFFCVADAEDFINSKLAEYGLTIDDMEEVWGTPGLSTYVPINETGISMHSIYHLYSSLLIDTCTVKNNTILSLALDAGPDNLEEHNAYFKSFYAGALIEHGNIRLFDISSPACLWSQMASATGLEEGTLMALGSATDSELSSIADYQIDFEIKKFSDTYTAANFIRKLMNYVSKLSKANLGNEVKKWDDAFDQRENQISMGVKVLQYMSVKLVKNQIDEIITKYRLNTRNMMLSISGGYGLNCPTNTELMNSYQFKDFLAVPCISDCGLSLGIGLYNFYNRAKDLNFTLNDAYYGNSDKDLDAAVKEYEAFVNNVNLFDEDTFIRDIEESPIVWFYGNSEIGPRALGHRSILGDPRNQKTKDILNEIKQRQWWRPVAPIIIEYDVDEWFEESYRSEFMLMTYKIREYKEKVVPSILHINGTARVQTVTESNEALYKILTLFKKKTGIPILCNTSLNDKGEPIIDTIPQAFNFCLRKKINVAYINGVRVEFKNHGLYMKKEPAVRQQWYIHDISEEEVNPYLLNRDEIEFYVYNAQLHAFDLSKFDEAFEVKKIINKIYKRGNNNPSAI